MTNTSLTKKRILIADDDPTILRLIETLLEREGFCVVSVADGKNAYKILKTGLVIDAAIFDVRMPYISGTDVVGFMRTTEQYRQVPVIIMTSGKDTRTNSRCFGLGAIAFLPKPFTNDQLKVVVNSCSSSNEVKFA